MEPFAVERPLIGMIHLLPLAGSVNYVKGSLSAILAAALLGLSALESGGADAAIVEEARRHFQLIGGPAALAAAGGA